jgi:TonB family protein
MALVYQPMTSGQRAWLAIAIAVAVHLVLLPFVAKDAVFKFVAPPKRAQISLVPWNGSSTTASNQRSQSSTSRPTTPKTAAEKKKEEEEKAAQLKATGQIVSIGAPQNQEAPVVPTKYLSEYDSRVLKETRARETSAFYKNALSTVQKEGKKERVDQQTKATVAPLAEPPPGTSTASGKEGGGRVQAAKEASTPTRERRDRVALQTAENGTVQNRGASEALHGNGRRLAMAQGASKSQIEGRGEGAPGGQQGAPSGTGQPLKLALDNPLETLGPIAGGPMSDHLPDVEEGDGTFLNTRAFIGASYLNRVKETVARIWTPDVQEAERTHDPTGQTYGYKDRSTLVSYTFNQRGDIVSVKVDRSSGVPFLDEIAVNAFKKAERIPNPPQQILGPDGTATFGFMFVLSSSGGSGLVRMGPAYMPGSPAARGW